MSRSKLFHIESDQRNSGTVSDFTFILPPNEATINAKRVVLKSCSLPNIFYNVSSLSNTLVCKYLTDSNVTVTFPIGFYTASQLAAAVTTALNSAMGGTSATSLTFNSITGKLTWEQTDVGGALIVQPASIGGTAHSILGLDSSTQFIVNQSLGLKVSPYPTNLIGLTSFNIHSTALAGGNYLEEDGSVLPVIMNIPITASFGGLNVYEASTEDLNSVEFSRPQGIQTIDIRLTDRTGNTIDLQNQNFKMLCKVYY